MAKTKTPLNEATQRRKMEPVMPEVQMPEPEAPITPVEVKVVSIPKALVPFLAGKAVGDSVNLVINGTVKDMAGDAVALDILSAEESIPEETVPEQTPPASPVEGTGMLASALKK